jgi:hypothetical protein
MHAKNTPLEFPIHEISNISRSLRMPPHSARGQDKKLTELANSLPRTCFTKHGGMAASYLTTKFDSRTNAGCSRRGGQSDENPKAA